MSSWKCKGYVICPDTSSFKGKTVAKTEKSLGKMKGREGNRSNRGKTSLPLSLTGFKYYALVRFNICPTVTASHYS